MEWNAMALVGHVARAHGTKGQVIVNPATDFPHERFRAGAELFVRAGSGVETLRIASVRFQHARPVIALDGISDMNAATTLAGAELRVPVDWLAPLPEGVFYVHDLVGCAVVTTAGEAVGEVSGVEGDWGGQRLIVHTPGGEAIVPLAAEICPLVDVVARRIVIAPPAGLLELNARGSG